MPAPRLRDLAISAAVRGLDGIRDVAELEYRLVRPILKAIDNPQHLADIEANSPHIANESEELWLNFIMRDIPNWKTKIVRPKDPRSWSKVYNKLMRVEQREQVEQERKLQAAMEASLQSIEDNRTHFVQKVMPGRSTTRGSGSTARQTPTLKNATAGRDILAAIRKQSANEARQKGIARSQGERQVIMKPQEQITTLPGHLTEALRKPARTPASPATKTETPTMHTQAIKATTKSLVFSKNTGPSRTDRLLDQAIRDEQVRKEGNDKRRAAGPGTPTSTSHSSPAHRPQMGRPPVHSPQNSPQRTTESSNAHAAKDEQVQGLHAMPEAQSQTAGAKLGSTTAMKRPAEAATLQPAAKRRPPPSIFMPQRRKA